MAKALAKGSRITGAQRGTLSAQYAKRYSAGESIRKIAEDAGRSFGFVHGVLKEAGVQLRGRGGATRGAKKTTSSAGKKAAVAPAKKAPATKAAAKKVVAKAPARKVPAKTAAKKVTAKAPAKTAVKKAPTKAAAKKVVAKAPAKTAAKKSVAKALREDGGQRRRPRQGLRSRRCRPRRSRRRRPPRRRLRPGSAEHVSSIRTARTHQAPGRPACCVQVAGIAD